MVSLNAKWLYDKGPLQLESGLIWIMLRRTVKIVIGLGLDHILNKIQFRLSCITFSFFFL